MKKDTKSLVLGLIGAAVGVIALVVWIVVIAIQTGFYSTKVNLCTTETYTTYKDGESSKAAKEGYQSWENFLAFSVTASFDSFYTYESGNYNYVNSGVTSENYTNYKNVTPTRITKDERTSGKVVFNSNETYYTFSSQSYTKIADLTSDNWSTASYGNIYTLVENNTTTKPTTTISVSPSVSNTFAPSSYDGISFILTFKYGLDGDTKTFEVGVNNKGYGSTTIDAFNISAATGFTHNFFNVDNVTGTVVKK